MEAPSALLKALAARLNAKQKQSKPAQDGKKA